MCVCVHTNICTFFFFFYKQKEEFIKKRHEKEAPTCIQDVYNYTEQLKRNEKTSKRAKTANKTKVPQIEPIQFTHEVAIVWVFLGLRS